jgi:hypothetical protein
MSPTLAVRWKTANFEETVPKVVLNPELSKVIHMPLVRRAGCLLFKDAAVNTRRGITRYPDPTTYECNANRFHVEDFVDLPEGRGVRALNCLTQQSARAAMELAESLEKEAGCRVLLQFDTSPAYRFPSGDLLRWDDGDARRPNDRMLCAFLTFYQRRSKSRTWSADKYMDFDVMTIDTYTLQVGAKAGIKR